MIDPRCNFCGHQIMPLMVFTDPLLFTKMGLDLGFIYSNC